MAYHNSLNSYDDFNVTNKAEVYDQRVNWNVPERAEAVLPATERQHEIPRRNSHWAIRSS